MIRTWDSALRFDLNLFTAVCLYQLLHPSTTCQKLRKTQALEPPRFRIWGSMYVDPKESSTITEPQLLNPKSYNVLRLGTLVDGRL